MHGKLKAVISQRVVKSSSTFTAKINCNELCCYIVFGKNNGSILRTLHLNIYNILLTNDIVSSKQLDPVA